MAINAGVGAAGDFARDNELRLIGLNITGAVHLAKRVLPEMLAAGQGGVLFTSSIAATALGPYHATYAASKAFLLSFAEALRYELRDTGVTVRLWCGTAPRTSAWRRFRIRRSSSRRMRSSG